MQPEMRAIDDAQRAGADLGDLSRHDVADRDRRIILRAHQYAAL